MGIPYGRSSYTEKELRDKGVCLSHLVVDDMTSGLYGRTLGVCVRGSRARERARSDAQPPTGAVTYVSRKGPLPASSFGVRDIVQLGPASQRDQPTGARRRYSPLVVHNSRPCWDRADRAGIVYRLDQFKITVAFEEYPDDAPTTSVSLIRLANEM